MAVYAGYLVWAASFGEQRPEHVQGSLGSLGSLAASAERALSVAGGAHDEVGYGKSVHCSLVQC